MMACLFEWLSGNESRGSRPARRIARADPRASNHRTQDHPSGHFLCIGMRATIASPYDPSR
jgi:hypothetical protein